MFGELVLLAGSVGVDGAGCSGSSGGKDGFVAEHVYEHDDGYSIATGCGGQDAGDGTAGAGGGADNNCVAVLPDAR